MNVTVKSISSQLVTAENCLDVSAAVCQDVGSSVVLWWSFVFLVTFTLLFSRVRPVFCLPCTYPQFSSCSDHSHLSRLIELSPVSSSVHNLSQFHFHHQSVIILHVLHATFGWPPWLPRIPSGFLLVVAATITISFCWRNSLLLMLLTPKEAHSKAGEDL